VRTAKVAVVSENHKLWIQGNGETKDLSQSETGKVTCSTYLRYCTSNKNLIWIDVENSMLTAEIRQEYQHVKHEAYCKGRSKILRDLLQQTSSIFATTDKDTHAKRRS